MSLGLSVLRRSASPGPRVDGADELALGVGIARGVVGETLGQLALQIGVGRGVGGVGAQVGGKVQVAGDLRVAGGEGVDMHAARAGRILAEIAPARDAVLPLGGIARGQQQIVQVVDALDVTHHRQDIDDRLGGQAGHLLAADKGKVGESYILAGPAIPLNEMVDFWAHLIGRKPPSLRLAGRPLRKFAPVAGAVSSVLPLPSLFSEEAVGSLGASYMARSDKARTELGWTTRPLQTGLLETFDWIARTEQENAPAQQERKWAGYALLAAAVLFLLWYLGRQKKK